MVRLEQIGPAAREFVLVRLLKISGMDLNLFDFDYDLTWAGFFMSADEKIHGRYGSRDGKGPDTRLSLAGLRYAMEQALAVHRQNEVASERSKEPPLKVEEYPAARRMRGGECIHCHQVYEFRRDALKTAGRWTKNEVWVYPFPENVGLTLDVDQGNRVQKVSAESPADRIGVRAGDTLVRLNGVAVSSIADVQYGLHRSPAKGPIPIVWRRGDEIMSGTLPVAEGWRRTNTTWRPSLLDILPSLTLFGEDLSVEEKKSLGLSARRLAFRQEKLVPTDLKTAGVRSGDIVIGLDNQTLDMTLAEFLAFVRRNYLVGEQVTLNLLRDGQRVDVPFRLR